MTNYEKGIRIAFINHKLIGRGGKERFALEVGKRLALRGYKISYYTWDFNPSNTYIEFQKFLKYVKCFYKVRKSSNMVNEKLGLKHLIIDIMASCKNSLLILMAYLTGEEIIIINDLLKREGFKIFRLKKRKSLSIYFQSLYNMDVLRMQIAAIRGINRAIKRKEIFHITIHDYLETDLLLNSFLKVLSYAVKLRV